MASAGSLLTQAEVTVDTTVGGTLLAAANAKRDAVIIRNNGDSAGADVFLGPSGVTTAAGMPLERGPDTGRRGDTLSIRGTAAVYGIVAAGSQTVRILEVTD